MFHLVAWRVNIHIDAHRCRCLQVLRNHVVRAHLPDLPDAPMGTLAAGSSLMIDRMGDRKFLGCSHTSNVAELRNTKKIATCVGLVYSVDDVLVPNTVACSAPHQTCGGVHWKGPICCAQAADVAYSCQPQNDFYSQCLCAPPASHLVAYCSAHPESTVWLSP